MITQTVTVSQCVSCGARMARDHAGTICSPCLRSEIERAAHRGSVDAREQTRIKAVFDSSGLYGVADHLGCDPQDALEVLLNARLLPFVTAPRRALLRRLAELRGLSHIDAAEALDISRWTVATYRAQLGIDRHSSCARLVNR